MTRRPIRVKKGSARLLGDETAERIEVFVLRPAEKFAPKLVAAARRCGGCTHAKHALGSDAPHPDQGQTI